MVLRIEDTDEARENPEAIEQIQRSLRWCGLDWDEGPGVGGPHAPYLQSERRALHLAAVEQMLERRDCLPLLLHRRGARRRAQGRAGCGAADRLLAQVPLADAPSSAPSSRPRAAGRRSGSRSPRTARSRSTTSCAATIRWENALLGDNVIVRSDGVPDLQPREPARRRRDGHHARHPRRRPAAVDAAPDTRLFGRSAPRSRATRTSR